MADLYKVLGVNPEDDATIIKRRYRELAMQLHPDRNGGDPVKMQRFQEVSIAYAILGNEAKRTEYDLRRKSPSPASPGGFYGAKFNDLVDRVATEGVTKDNWSELFADLFGTASEFGKAAPNFAKRAKDSTETIFGGEGSVLDTLETIFGIKEKKK
jgi:DnaJ-class molecular chaperone